MASAGQPKPGEYARPLLLDTNQNDCKTPEDPLQACSPLISTATPVLTRLFDDPMKATAVEDSKTSRSEAHTGLFFGSTSPSFLCPLSESLPQRWLRCHGCCQRGMAAPECKQDESVSDAV